MTAVWAYDPAVSRSGDQEGGTTMPNEDHTSTATIEAPTQTTGRQPWTPGQKAKSRKAQKVKTGKRALKLSIENETYERLTIYSLKTGMNLSELVDQLARDHCNSWVLHARPGPKTEA
jgi:hypothetical protein